MVQLTHGRIEGRDFARMFGVTEDSFPQIFVQQLQRTESCWRLPTQEEVEAYVLDVIKRIEVELKPRSVDENRAAFETGWSENLQELIRHGTAAEILKPKYFRKTKYLRYNKGLIVSDNLDLEYDLFVLARHVIFWKYFREFDHIYEFGCGSCASLLMMSEMFPDKDLIGLDWVQSSSRIAEHLARTGPRRVRGAVFDMLNPLPDLAIEPNSAIITIHALEQLGNRFGPWLDFLLRAKPAIVVNYEPILEFYDHDNLWDYLAFLYSLRRNYLNGYYSAIRELEKNGRVQIIEQRRPYLGGVVHEASLVVWRPV